MKMTDRWALDDMKGIRIYASVCHYRLSKLLRKLRSKVRKQK